MRLSQIPLPSAEQESTGRVYVKKRYVFNPVTLERVGEECYVPDESDRGVYVVPDHFSLDYRGLRLIETDEIFDVVPILPPRAPAPAKPDWSVVPGSILFWTEDAVKYWLRKKAITQKQASYFYEWWEGRIDERRLEDDHQDHTGIGNMRWSVNHTDGMIDEYPLGLSNIDHYQNEDLWYLQEQDGTPFHFCRYFGKDATYEASEAAKKSGLYGFLPYHVESVKADIKRYTDKVIPPPIRRNHCRCFSCEGARKHHVPLFDDGRERFMDIVESNKSWLYKDYEVSSQFNRVGIKSFRWKYIHVLHAKTCSCAGRSLFVRTRNTGCSSPILCLAIRLQAIRLYRVYRYLMEGEQIYGSEHAIQYTMCHPEPVDGLWSDDDDQENKKEREMEEERNNNGDDVDDREANDGRDAETDDNKAFVEIDDEVDAGRKADEEIDAVWSMVEEEVRNKKARSTKVKKRNNNGDDVDGRETNYGRDAEIDDNKAVVEIDDEVDAGRKAEEEIDAVRKIVEEEVRNKKARSTPVKERGINEHDKSGAAGHEADDEVNDEIVV